MTLTTIDLSGKRALITGAAGGLGTAIAEQLMACGAVVALNDRTEDLATEASREIGARMGVGADISNESEVRAMVERVISGLGGIDLLVNNAGVPGDYTRTIDQSVDDWQRVVDVHLRGTFLVSREVGRELVRQRSGAVVNIGSIVGLVGYPAANAYGVTKAGVAMMTRTMGIEWGRYGVRVNCVAPGIMDAGMFEKILHGTGMDRDPYLERIPMGQFGTAEDVAMAVTFLMSQWASYINGVTLPIDGGFTAFGGPARRRAASVQKGA